MPFQQKLSNLQAAQAMVLLAQPGMTQREVAARFGVHQATISRIKNNPDRGEKKERPRPPCGTDAAYQKHLREGEVADEACLKARSQALKKYRKSKPKPPLVPCGTRSAYTRHRRRKEEPCEACLEAWRLYLQEWRAERKAHREALKRKIIEEESAA